LNDSLNLSNNIKAVKNIVEDNVNYAYNIPKEYLGNKITYVNEKLNEKVSNVKD